MNTYKEMTQKQAQDLVDRLNTTLDYNKANIALSHLREYGVVYELFNCLRIGYCLEELTREVETLEETCNK